MVYKSKFKNQQLACEALAEKDILKWCKNVNLPFNEYHQDIMMKITLTESGKFKNGFYVCKVKIKTYEKDIKTASGRI
jgi:predicted RNA-binding protein with PUA domain